MRNEKIQPKLKPHSSGPNFMTDAPNDERLEVEVDRGAANCDEAVEGVVLAAHGLRRAASTSDTNNIQGRAGQANFGSHAVENDAKEAKQKRD